MIVFFFKAHRYSMCAAVWVGFWGFFCLFVLLLLFLLFELQRIISPLAWGVRWKLNEMLKKWSGPIPSWGSPADSSVTQVLLCAAKTWGDSLSTEKWGGIITPLNHLVSPGSIIYQWFEKEIIANFFRVAISIVDKLPLPYKPEEKTIHL